MQLLVLAALLGTLFPPFIAIVQQERWPSGLRATVTVILCAAAAYATVWGRGDWHGWRWPSVDLALTAFIGLLLGTYGSLSKFWRQLLGGRLIDAIEHSTSVSVLIAWWRTHRAAVEAAAVTVLTPEQLAAARQIIAAEQSSATPPPLTVSTGISPASASVGGPFVVPPEVPPQT